MYTGTCISFHPIDKKGEISVHILGENANSLSNPTSLKILMSFQTNKAVSVVYTYHI